MITRMRQLIAAFSEGIGDRAWILKAVADEVLAELDDRGAAGQHAQMMLQAAAILQWVATGVVPEDADEFVAAMTGQTPLRELTSAPH